MQDTENSNGPVSLTGKFGLLSGDKVAADQPGSKCETISTNTEVPQSEDSLLTRESRPQTSACRISNEQELADSGNALQLL